MKSDQAWKYLSTVNIVLLYRHKTRISYLFKNLQHDVRVVSCSAAQEAFITHPTQVISGVPNPDLL